MGRFPRPGTIHIAIFGSPGTIANVIKVRPIRNPLRL